MLKAILFDLDNTLILYKESDLLDFYMRRITPYFDDVLSPAEFQQRLYQASRALSASTGKKNNRELFFRSFAHGLEGARNDWWGRFQRFYHQELDTFQSLVSLPPGLPAVFAELADMRLQLILASNPLFPESVQLQRFGWTGIKGVNFELVTHIENMSFCKPSRQYYHQTCELIGLAPHQCLMVGNDPVNDMAAGQIGLTTYLTTDWRSVADSLPASAAVKQEDEKRDIPLPDFTGPLANLPLAVRTVLNGVREQ